ncbi:MAG: exosome complex protein Rrp42 [Euryarchaeota archaeon]|nr:exosome complex protein Rrp42 [Euryarchaeota archaeon]
MEADVVSDLKRDYINRLLVERKRIDGRSPDELRHVEVQTGVVTSASGSARVRWGATEVMVGVMVEQGTPFPDTPDRGVLVTNAELIPMASPHFEPGPPRPESIELARVVDRGIREAQTIDLSKMCVTPKEKVYLTYVDMHVLDYGGNLFDAGLLGAMMALNTATVPAKRFGNGEDFPLPVRHYPISITSVKVQSGLLVDPNLDEERVAETRLTVTTDENGDVRAMQKGLAGKLTFEEVQSIIQASQRCGAELRKRLGLGVR